MEEETRLELQRMIMNNFTGENNSWDDIMNKLDEYRDAILGADE